MKNQVFNAFWHGPELSPLHWACLKSFPDHGHRMRVFTYQPVLLPPGVERMDARHVRPEADVFEFNRSYAAFSNIFRYQLLLDEGGWWVDADVYCQSEDIPDCAYAWAQEDEEKINSAVMKFPAGDPVLRAILDDAQKTGKNVKVWGEIGPNLVTAHIAGREFPGHWGSTRDMYPIHWIESHLLWLPGGAEGVRERCAGSPFVHLWAAMFRQFGIDIHKPAPEGSYLRWIAQQSGHPAGRVPANEVFQAWGIQGMQAFLSEAWVREKWRRMYGSEPSLAVPA